MYFWDVKELKGKLRRGEIAEGQAFGYFLAILILDTLLIATWGLFPLDEDLSPQTYTEAGGYFLMVVVGTVLLYLRNGGKKGIKFFVRYFSLLWVVGIRFLAVTIPLATIYLFLVFSPEEDTWADTWYETATYLLVTGLYYWRLRVHIGDVADANHAK